MKKNIDAREDNKIIKNVSVFFIILTLACAFYLTFNIAFKYKVIGDDFRFHLNAAEIYAGGENALFNKEILNSFGGPYPPLFHLFLAIFVRLGIVMQAATFLQIIFYPLVLLSAAFLVWKKKGILATAFTIILMFTSIALFDRAQIIPQSIDMILFPIAIFYFLENKKMPFIVLMTIMIYSHGYFPLLLLLAVALFSFIEKKNQKAVILTTILSLPLIILSLEYLPSYLASRTETNLLLTNPLFILSYFGINLALFLPLALIYFFIERKNLDELDKISIYWLLATLLFAFKFPERMASYSVAPASIIISKMFSKFSSINKIYGMLVGIFLLIQIFLFGFFANFMKWFNILRGIGIEKFNVA